MSGEAWKIHDLAKARAAAGHDVIILSVGEDRTAVTHPALVDVAKHSLDAGKHHYAPTIGSEDLRAAIAKRHFRTTGQTVTPDSCCLFSGAQNALFSVSLALLNPGDEIIVPEPFYATYPGVARAGGANMVTVRTDPEADFVLDPDRLSAAVTDRTRVILINSPNNPTGACYPRDVMEAVADICKKHDLWLISDEVYSDFVYDADHVAPGALPGMAERTVTIGSLSKSYRMSGWRIGWAVSNPELNGILDDLICCMLYGGPSFVQDAALSALAEPPLPGVEEDKRDMLEAYHRKRDMVMGMLGDTPGLILRRPSAGMFVMVDIRPTGLSDFEFAFKLLEEEDVSVMTGSAFGPSAVGHLRLGLVAHEDMLAEACRRIDRLARKLMA
ncbi:pyridoxal phosphate-dependent aminotransferase [Pacificispira spongiicola]|nr:pyridoxal phosphate-dependent aminotransferase [Pacificispira spongiicola]